MLRYARSIAPVAIGLSLALWAEPVLDPTTVFLAAVIVARNPGQYGMEITPEPVDEPKFETVTLSVAVDLRRVAEWVGTTAEAIQDLNPELRRWTTPVRSTNYELRVPEGTAEIGVMRSRLGPKWLTRVSSLALATHTGLSHFGPSRLRTTPSC